MNYKYYHNQSISVLIYRIDSSEKVDCVGGAGVWIASGATATQVRSVMKEIPSSMVNAIYKKIHNKSLTIA